MFEHAIDERTDLRLLQARHAAEHFRVTDANREHLRTWLPWVDDVQEEQDSANFIRAALREFGTDGTFVCGIWRDGALCGTIGYNAIDWSQDAAKIGYWLAASHSGQGIMTAACREIVRHAFEEYGLNRVVIGVATGNLRSQAIPERLGFRNEGVRREAAWLHDRFVDITVNALLASEWRPERPERPGA